jgi:hypothetical protein
MNLYMLAESEDLAELESDISASLKTWLAGRDGISFVNHRVECDAGDNLQNSVQNSERQWELGIKLIANSKVELKEPLRFLYAVAKHNKCEFVVGIIHEHEKEDICYFGNEEGRPDMHEVAMYLGLPPWPVSVPST